MTAIELRKCFTKFIISKNKTSEYDQELPQSHTTDLPMAPQRKSHRTLTVTRHQEDSQSKKAALFPINIIALLEGHEVLNSKPNTEPPQTMGPKKTIN